MIALMLALLATQPQPREAEVARPERLVRQILAPIDDARLIAFMRGPFDPMSDETRWPRTLGSHRGIPVIVSYTCSDVCPNYTKRIVRYNLYPGEECTRAGGISRDIVVPEGIGTGLTRYCIPAATAPYQR